MIDPSTKHEVDATTILQQARGKNYWLDGLTFHTSLYSRNQNPELPLKQYKFIKWQKEIEMADLVKFDIGLMPLSEDKWAKGKCGFKALQYMALATHW